jgi:hypothetical protein
VFAAFIIIKVVNRKFVLELAKGVADGGHNTSVSLPQNSDPYFLVPVRPCHIALFFRGK